MNSSAIDIRGLGKRYSGTRAVVAVNDLDLQVEPGEIFGLLGPNGAGKTTTVGICTTRVLPSSGEVRVDGADVVRTPVAVRRAIGVVSQYNTLDRSLTAWENLYFHCRYFGWGRAEARRRADELLALFKLTERGRAMPDELSGGMAQRLQLARALAHRPRVLFLDEPTTGLDPQSRLALWEMVAGLRSSGVTVLLTTHNMEEAERLCDRIAIIDHGRILVCDTPAALKRSLGAETVIELKLERAPTAELEAELSGLGGVASCRSTGTEVRLMVRSGSDIMSRVVGAAAGAGLSDISIREPTLETVFITLTGRALRE